MTEIFDMTLEQLNMYGEAINRKNSNEFKTMVNATMLGSQGSPEEVIEYLNQEQL